MFEIMNLNELSNKLINYITLNGIYAFMNVSEQSRTKSPKFMSSQWEQGPPGYFVTNLSPNLSPNLVMNLVNH